MQADEQGFTSKIFSKEAMPSKSLQPNKSTVEAPQAQKSSPVPENIKFGFFEPSLPPSVLSSLVVASKGSEPAESPGNKKEMYGSSVHQMNDLVIWL